MAFGNNDLNILIPRPGLGAGVQGKGAAVWSLRTNDADPTGTGYVTAGEGRGMRAGDIVLASIDEDGTALGKIYTVSIESDGDATLS